MTHRERIDHVQTNEMLKEIHISILQVGTHDSKG